MVCLAKEGQVLLLLSYYYYYCYYYFTTVLLLHTTAVLYCFVTNVYTSHYTGAFSDGKLTTRTRSPYHRFVHETLMKYGAKENILFESRAHIGMIEVSIYLPIYLISNYLSNYISN